MAAAPAPEKTLGSELDALEPRVQKTEFLFEGEGGLSLVYTLRPLSYFGKMELISVLGDALNRAMRGPDGVRLSDIINAMPDKGEEDSPRFNLFNASGMETMEPMVASVAKLVTFFPELIKEIYCLALGIPRMERTLAIMLMDRPVEEGGLSDDDGLEILEGFVSINGEVLRSFFADKVMPMLERVRKTGPRLPVSPSPKRSRTSPQPTGSK